MNNIERVIAKYRELTPEHQELFIKLSMAMLAAMQQEEENT